MNNKIIMIMAACLLVGVAQGGFFCSKTRGFLKTIGTAAFLKGIYNGALYTKELKEDIQEFKQKREEYKLKRRKASEDSEWTIKNAELIKLNQSQAAFSRLAETSFRRLYLHMQSVDEKYPWYIKDMMLDVSDKRHKSLRQNTFKELEHIDKFCGATSGHEYFSMAYEKPLIFLYEKWIDISEKALDKLNTSPRNIDRHANALKTTGFTWAAVGATALWCARKLRK